jgi:alpha-D-ribose 1-methylphosphonate 5-triphosphate synthase subunit PhnH
MMLDMVHDIQTAYRKLIDSMSKPGTISDLAEEAGKLEQLEGYLPATYIAARMLLDTEVTFKVVSKREKEMALALSQSTYAKEVELEEADFIFILSDAEPSDFIGALQTAKIGELQDPHSSATIIIETAGLSGGTKLLLSGPGIQTTDKAEIQVTWEWIAIRAERNIEFPLGLDLIFTDSSHRMLALPRTTQVMKEEV